MISKKIQDALNGQINAELYSAYLYLSMSSYFSSINLMGFANWMRVQALEEQTHAAKFFDFIISRGGRAELKLIDGPPIDFKSSMTVFEDTLKHEQKVTGLINNLVNLAVDEKDHATNIFLQWFVTEQIEEESNAEGLIQKLKLIGEGGNGLFMLDAELAARMFLLPPTIGIGGAGGKGGGKGGA